MFGYLSATIHYFTARAERLQRSQQELRSQGGGRDPLAAWGREMVQLRQRVQQAVEGHHFSKPPLGPVGFYLRLKDQRWAKALEHIIGNKKTSFCVNSHQDIRKLNEIIDQVYGANNANNGAYKKKPGVTCTDFLSTRHDVSARRVRAQPCALDVLDIEEPVIANFLIDNLRLETVLLVADRDEAIRKADTEANVPANCSKIVTEDCSEFYPAPNYRSYGRDSRRLFHQYLLLGTEDGERRLREAEAALREAEAALREQQLRAAEAREEAQLKKFEERKANRELQALLEARLSCEAKRREAERACERHRSPQLDELEQELVATKRFVQGLQAELEESLRVKSEFKRKIDESEGHLAQINTKLERLQSKESSLLKQMADEKSKVEVAEASVQNCRGKLNDIQVTLDKLRDEHKQKEAEKSNKALATGTRVDNPRDQDTLRKLLREKSKQLEAADNLGLDVETVNAEMARAEMEYRNLRDLLNSFDELIKETKKAIDDRLRFCFQLGLSITRRVNISFGHILATGKYNGLVRMEYSSGELKLELSGRDGTRPMQDASSLSGGERSYCTVALLLALWECVELPFYFLDEFDVFVDLPNRQLLVDLLLDFARQHPSRQFVFLAPEPPHADALKGARPLQLHRLEDPRP